MNRQAQRETLRQLFAAAIEAVDAERCLPPALPEPPHGGRLVVLAAGKGAAAMVRAAERHYREAGANAIGGLAVTRKGFALPTHRIELMEAGHPVPDANSVRAAQRALDLARSATPADLVLVLLSGGASALWTAPVDGVALEDKQTLTRRLLEAGAPIDEVNCVRKHLSRIKGGRLAAAAAPAPLVTLAVSDVPRDDPSTIGSGPTVGDPTTLQEAKAILRRRRIAAQAAILEALDNPANETPFPGDPVFAQSRYRIIARPADALAAAAARARTLGYAARLLGDAVEGEAHEVARAHAALALSCRAAGRRVALLSGGELTVTVHGGGRGGPNQEYALALAVALAGRDGIAALAADSDGADGGSGAPHDPAGAIIDATTLERSRRRGLDPVTFLENNDSTGFFAAIGDLVVTGPTHTNVNDVRVILVDP